MSLMNDMLRDLDRNGHTGARRGEGNEELLAGSSLVRKQRRVAWLPALLGFAVVAALVGFKPWTMIDGSVATSDKVADTPVIIDVAAESTEDSAKAITDDSAAIVEAPVTVAQEHEAEQPVASLANTAEPAQEAVVQTVSARVQPVPVEVNQAAPPAPAEPVRTATARAAQPTAGQNQVSVVRSPEWRDRHAAEQAQQLFNEGREQAAREHLLALIADHPTPVASATLLATLYLQSGEVGIAEEFIRAAKYLPVPVQTRLSAQALMARGDNAGALGLLEENLPQAQRDEEYRALLAALQHKQGAYESSANQYRRLLGDFGERPVYWLGLALALDAQREHGSAIEAYRRARGGQQPAVLNYIDQRIAALAR